MYQCWLYINNVIGLGKAQQCIEIGNCLAMQKGGVYLNKVLDLVIAQQRDFVGV